MMIHAFMQIVCECKVLDSTQIGLRLTDFDMLDRPTQFCIMILYSNSNLDLVHTLIKLCEM